MKNYSQLKNAILIGCPDIVFLDTEEQQRFYLSMADYCKEFFKNPSNLAEFQQWQEQHNKTQK